MRYCFWVALCRQMHVGQGGALTAGRAIGDCRGNQQEIFEADSYEIRDISAGAVRIFGSMWEWDAV